LLNWINTIKKMKNTKRKKRKSPSEETKQKRQDTMYKKKHSPEAIENYLDSIKNVNCGQRDLITLHIPLKRH